MISILKMGEKEQVINLDELLMELGEPRWAEEIRSDENGEVIACVLKRNPNHNGR